MKKNATLIFLFILAASLCYPLNSFSQGKGNPKFTLSFEPISVSGKVILDTSKKMTRYFLDTDNNGTKEYELSFGPKWYVPTTGAVRPNNGDVVSITGDVFSMTTPPIIMVYTINGLKWRDSLESRSLRNKLDPDSLRLHFSPCANHFGWAVKDSLIPITVSGKAIVDSLSTHHKVFYLDVSSDGTKDYILMLGPWWYQPASGAKRPNNGDMITVKGGVLQKDSSEIKIIVVQELNGLAWIDSLGKFPWPGHIIKENSNNPTFVGSIYDPRTYCQFSSNAFGIMMSYFFPSEIYSSISEIDPVDLPITTSDNIIAAFSVNVTDNFMKGIFMPFTKSIAFNLSYNQSELSVGKYDNKNLQVKYLSDDNELYDVSNAKIDYTTKTAAFSQNLLNGTYVIEATEPAKVTSLEETSIPEKFSLNQNYPNPFNPETIISFDLPEKGSAKLTIYNILGSEIRSLINSEFDKGTFSVTWNGKDNHGKDVASGVYIYKLEFGNTSLTKKMNLIR
jgi:hypothetical protein